MAPDDGVMLHRNKRCFNEAAGIHRRKRVCVACQYATLLRASMRPPEFTGGNFVTAVLYGVPNTGLQ